MPPTIPAIDLLYLQGADGVRMMGGLLRRPDGCLVESGTFPAEGAIRPIADAFWSECEHLFATRADLEGYLTIIHFDYMSAGQNRAGMDYPAKLPFSLKAAP